MVFNEHSLYVIIDDAVLVPLYYISILFVFCNALVNILNLR